MSRGRAGTFLNASHGGDFDSTSKISTYNEQIRVHSALQGEWVFKGRFDKHGNFVKTPKDQRATFQIKLTPASAAFKKAIEENRTPPVSESGGYEVACVIKAKKQGETLRKYLNPITVGKSYPWRMASFHILSPSESACLPPPQIKEHPREADLIRRKTLEVRGWLDKSLTAISLKTKEVYNPNPDVRIHKNGHGFPDSDFIMEIGKVTLYGHLDAKLNYIKLTYSVATGVEYGVLRRKDKYTGPDRFESLRVDWNERIGIIVCARASKCAEGAIINVVHPGSPAFKAGLKLGDRIVAIERFETGERYLVHDSLSFKAALSRCEALQPYTWKINRGGESWEAHISLRCRYDPDNAIEEL